MVLNFLSVRKSWYAVYEIQISMQYICSLYPMPDELNACSMTPLNDEEEGFGPLGCI
jgi:hypothetical protein